MKQIEELRKFAKVDIKKLRKQQKREAERALREQQIQAASKKAK